MTAMNFGKPNASWNAHEETFGSDGETPVKVLPTPARRKGPSDLIPKKDVTLDNRPPIEVGISKKTGQPLKVVFKNGIPHLEIFRVNKGQPEVCIMSEPYEYPKVKPREDSDYHTKFAYLTQAKIEFYNNALQITESVIDGFNCLVFQLQTGEEKIHIMQQYRKDDEFYVTVSRDPWVL